MKRISLTLLLAALSLVAASAQGLTLDECRRLALRNNAAVEIATAETEAAHQVRQEALTKYFPTVSAQGMSFWTDRPIVDYNVLDLFSIQLLKKGTIAGVTAVQPLFAGGRIVNGNRLAAVGEKVAQLRRQATIDRTLLTVERYYWQVVTLEQKKVTLASVIAMTDTLQRQVKVAVDAGVALPNELLHVDLFRNQYLSAMVDLDNGIALSRDLLAQAIGLSGEKITVAVSPIDPKAVPELPDDIYLPTAQALPQTADYQLLEQNVDAAKLQLKMEVGANLPTVGVGAGYFYDRFLSQDNHYGGLFVTISVPISGWWGGSHSISKRRIQKRNAELQLEDASQLLQIKMQSAWDDLTAARRKMVLAAEAISQSAENLRLNENYYAAGVVTITDLLDAQTLYRQSLDRYVDAFGDFSLKRALYLDATGRTPVP